MGVQEEDRSITTPETAGQAMSTEISDVTSSAEETSADMEVTRAAKAIPAAMEAGRIEVTSDSADEEYSEGAKACVPAGDYKR